MALSHKEKDLKWLIPALIISLIIAIILILIFNKYVFKPIFEGRGLLNQKTLVVVRSVEDGSKERINTLL